MQAAALHGVAAYHTHDSRRSNPGWPDVVLVGARGAIFRELKTAKGKTTPMQDYWLEALVEAGQDAAVWRPADWPDRIVAEIKALGRVTVPTPQMSQAEALKRVARRGRK